MDICDRPLAAAGLNSYRYRGRYGWVMIGARDHADALKEAARSVSDAVTPANLEYWDGARYVPAVCRSTPINSHGDLTPHQVAPVRVYGKLYYVDALALSGSNVMLRQYAKNGKLRGRFDSKARTWTAATPIHRDNIGVSA